MNPPRARVLGVPVDALDVEGALDVVRSHLEARTPLQIVTLNAEMAIRARNDTDFAQVVHQAGLVLPDGSGVVWALRRQGIRVRKLAGVEFVEHLAALCARDGRRLYLLGAGPGVADEAASRLAERHPGLATAGARDGFFSAEEEPALLAELAAARPDVLLVALGVPRQELWIAARQRTLAVPVCMGVGGSFDVLAGRVRRAPRFMRILHLEWLYRLLREPWRWRRMATTLPRFAVLALRDNRACQPGSKLPY